MMEQETYNAIIEQLENPNNTPIVIDTDDLKFIVKKAKQQGREEEWNKINNIAFKKSIAKAFEYIDEKLKTQKEE